MQSNKIYHGNIFIVMISLLLLSCATQNKSMDENDKELYLNSDYEVEKRSNFSLGVIIQDVGLDTINVNNLPDESKPMYYFGKSFREQFPAGMKYFSKFDPVEWIYYDPYLLEESLDYKYLNDQGEERYLTLPYTMEQFREKYKLDFLMFIKYLSVLRIDPEQSQDIYENNKKYKTKIVIDYYLWDNRTLDLISINNTSANSEFDKLKNQWPYKNVIYKLAAQIIEELPMFKK